MFNPFSSSSLFKVSPNCRTVSVAGSSTTYAINSSGAPGKELSPYRPSGLLSNTAKYSYALLAYKFWQENRLLVLKHKSKHLFYVSYEDPYSDPATKDKAFLILDERAIPDKPYSTRTQAAIVSIMAALELDLFTPLYENTPLMFCDAVYYGYAKKRDFMFSDIPDPTITAQVKRGYESGEWDVLIGELSLKKKPIAEKSKSVKPLHDFQYYKDGNAFIDFEWKRESKEKISPLSFLEDFVPTSEFFSLAQKIEYRVKKVIERMYDGMEGRDAIKNDYLNIRLTGNPGSGKTVLGYALSSALGLPIYTVPIQKHTEEDTFEGKNKLVDNKFTFVTTDFLDAYKNGGIVVLEEINLADPALIMGALGQAIEPPFIVNENGYSKVTRHPLCIVIATQNVGTTGSKGVNQALVSRFPHTYVINDPTSEEFIERLMLRYPDKAVCEWVYNSYITVKTWLCAPEQSAEDIALALTFRACTGILDDIEEGIPKENAIMKFYAIIYGESPEIADKALTVIKSLPGM